MGGKCDTGEYWDALVKRCSSCKTFCKNPQVFSRCQSYCENTNCRAQPGHFYDALLKKCMRCAEVCGRHPSECSQHCQVSSTPLTTAQAPVQELLPTSRGLPVPATLINSTIVLYSLLALCLVLLLSSLTLALVTLFRLARAKSSNPESKKRNNQESVVLLGQGVDVPCVQRSQDFVTKRSHETSDDSSPTETCVCIHCFPDLKALGQSNSRPLKAPTPNYQQDALHRSHIQKGGSIWTERDLYASGVEVQEEAAVGGGQFATSHDKCIPR